MMMMKKNRLLSLVLALILVVAFTATAVFSGCKPDEPTPPAEATVTAITLDTSETKTTFEFGEEFTYEGLKVTAELSDGTKKAVDLKECKVSTPSMTTPGQRRVTVSYEGKTAQYTITINERVLPEISEKSLLDIKGENESNAYRLEAETFDMETPGAKLADGYKSFVAEAPEPGEGEEPVVISGDKYLDGYGVEGNYIGFTFTSDKEYKGVTLVLRVSNPGESAITLADNMKMYLNYESDEDTHGEISLSGRTVEAGGEWVDVVIRDVTIPAGTSTITFDIIGESVPAIDYIDFYVGARYISSVIEFTSVTEESPVFVDLEDFDTEMARTRKDFADAHGIPEDQIYLEQVQNAEQAANTSRGTSVAALASGSQLSTTLRLAQDATIEIKIKVASVENYIVKDNWNFSIDGYSLNGVESTDIKDGNPAANEYWLWKEVSLGVYNISAGDHLFLLSVVGGSCNIDGLSFDVISYGEFDESGVDIDEQPEAQLEPEAQLSKNGVLRLEAEELRYKDGLVLRDDSTSFTETWNRDGKSGVCLKGFTAESEIKAVIEVEEATTVSISFMMSYYDSTEFDFSKSVITFDGQTLTATPEGEFGHDNDQDYWKWNKVNLSPVEVEAGVHTLSIVFNEKGMNLDYFEFVGGDGSDVPEEPVADASVGIGDTVKVEAENTDPSGWIARGDWQPDTPFTEAWNNDMGSGVSLKGMETGSVVTFTVEVKEKCTLSVKSSMAYYDDVTYNFAENTVIKIGEQTLTATPAEEFGHRNDTDWWKWVNVDLGSVTLDAGVYTFTMTFNAVGLNIDFFELVATAAV